MWTLEEEFPFSVFQIFPALPCTGYPKNRFLTKNKKRLSYLCGMKQTGLAISLELIFWIATAIIAAAVLYPILSVTNDYRFLVPNIVFIVILVTCTRYIFLLKHTWLAKLQVVKTAIIFGSIWGLFLVIEQINKFQTFLDEEGPEALVPNLSGPELNSIVAYIKSEVIFFGVGSVIAILVLCGRLLQSIWNYRNRGLV